MQLPREIGLLLLDFLVKSYCLYKNIVHGFLKGKFVHTLGLVIGENPDQQLQLYAEYSSKQHIKMFLTEEDIFNLANRYNVERMDLDSLRSHIKDWYGEEGFIENQKLGYFCDKNVRVKFDFYSIGGRWNDLLKLKTPRKSISSFFGGKPKEYTNQARQCEIDIEALKDNVPHFVLFEGKWQEDDTVSLQNESSPRWIQTYHNILNTLAPNSLITVVDIHF